VSEPITDARKPLEGLAVRLNEGAKKYRCVPFCGQAARALNLVADEIEHLLREHIVDTRLGMDPSISPRDSPAQTDKALLESWSSRHVFGTHECPGRHRQTRNTTAGCDHCGLEDK
jgi:hypothetical protein